MRIIRHFQVKRRWKVIFVLLLVIGCLIVYFRSLPDSPTVETPPPAVLSDNSQDLHRKTFGEIDPSAPPPFEVGISTSSPHFFPDLRRQADFRTTKMAYFNGQAYRSRSVFYHTSADVKGVLVLPLNAQMPNKYLRSVLAERLEYCLIHNYGLYARYAQDFSAPTKPKAERLDLAALRMLQGALAAFPSADWFWLLTSDFQLKNTSIPMPPLDPNYNLTTNLMPTGETATLERRSFATNTSELDAIVSTNEDTGQVSAQSVLVRSSLPAQVLLSLATDPLMQDYRPFVLGFDHAESVLTHLAKWHPRLLSHVGLLPPLPMGISVCVDGHPVPLACARTLASV